MSSFKDLTVKELKEELKARDLKLGGNKAELLTRLQEATADPAATAQVRCFLGPRSIVQHALSYHRADFSSHRFLQALNQVPTLRNPHRLRSEGQA